MKGKRFIEQAAGFMKEHIILTIVEKILDLLKIIVWPVVVIYSIVFFRKVFTYLFFSLEEFNFFGAKGRLKNVQEMIREQSEQQRDREKQEENYRELEKKLQTSNQIRFLKIRKINFCSSLKNY